MNKPNYPFLKITREPFPRLLVTRRPDKNEREDKIFGAFLPAVSVRYFLDLMQRILRLRTCELKIDGGFDAPCPEYFLHRCLAPCVAKLCNERTYSEAVESVRLLLENRGDVVLNYFDREIEVLSANLEFEKARKTLKRRQIIAEILSDSKWKIGLFDATDVLTSTVEGDVINLYLTTLRRGKIIGQQNLSFLLNDEIKGETDIFAPFIKEFYEYYLPKQIFVSADFAERHEVEKLLNKKFARKTKIIAEISEKLPPTVRTAQKTTEMFQSNKHLRGDIDAEKILETLQKDFSLKNSPRRIECFDVAHLAGEAIVAARILAIDAVVQKDEEIVWQFENLSETESLARSIYERLKILPSKKFLPEFILLDGGRPQISRMRKILAATPFFGIMLVGAVKPPKRHAEISHFLLENGVKVLFDERNAAHQFLKQMRDAAHKLSNTTHRDVHSLAVIFTKNSNAPKVRLLYVPLRFAERAGFADDLQPLRSLNQAGELIYKNRKSAEMSGEKYKRRSRFSRPRK